MLQSPLKEYASLIHLNKRYSPSSLFFNKEDYVNELLEDLLKENKDQGNIEIPDDYAGKRNILRGLLNVREPKPLPIDFLNKLDSLLQTELKEKGVVEVEQLETVSTLFSNNLFNQSDKIILWQGDITRLKADAIVNAANKYMLGCFQPLHACIDNAIHSASGPQLREDCKTIISVQDELEITGGAKITRGYNLPSKYVLHTVGPIVPKGTKLTDKQRAELASCYTSCLELANQKTDIKTVAFCAISTGVFGFPKSDAAKIAVNVVNDWLNSNTHQFEKIIFNVFSEEDFNEYFRLFKQG